MAISKVNLSEKFASFDEHWSPKLIGELNQQEIRIAKFKGDFIMHSHDNEDEFFLVVKGEIFIELLDHTLHLKTGECVTIPRGVEHRPYAPEEAHVLMFEPASTVNTGQHDNDMTKKELEKI